MKVHRSASRLLIAGLLAGALALATAGCGGPTPGSPLFPTTAGPAVIADGLRFDAATLTVPASAAFGLELVNREGVPHNVAIYRDSSATEVLFRGDVFSGPATRVYTVPGLPPGTWFFRCDVHPDMHGELIAAATASP